MYLKQNLIRGFITAPLVIGTFGVLAGSFWWGFLPGLLVGVLFWWWRLSKKPLPKTATALLMPHAIVLATSLGAWCAVLFAAHFSYANAAMIWAPAAGPFYSLSLLVAMFGVATGLPQLMLVNFFSALTACGIVLVRRQQKLTWSKNAAWPLIAVVAIATSFGAGQYVHHLRYLDHVKAPSAVNMNRYVPFSQHNQLPTVASTLHFQTKAPRLDGATAAYPLYAAFAQATYPKQHVNRRVQVNQTSYAYENLIAGDCDMVFAYAPNAKQKAAAKKAGVKLVYTPIAQEAFVFFVAKNNPVKNLSTKQLQAIYQHDLTNWSQVGGHWTRIRAFQRPAGSGSQTAMENLVMHGKPMAKPLESEVVDGMGGIISAVADYENAPSDLGYSFRYYLQGMQGASDLQLLKINGVAPTPANIKSGHYPLTLPLMAVTTDHPSAKTQALLKWIQGAQGQQLVEKTGYIPLAH